MRPDFANIDARYRLRATGAEEGVHYEFAAAEMDEDERTGLVAALAACEEKSSFIPTNGTGRLDAIILVIPVTAEEN